MGRDRNLSRNMARETLLALLVLALAFLNFGHASISLGGELRVVPDAWCGDPLLPDSPEHSPCHACRIGSGADLPPQPACVSPVVFATTPIAYAEPDLALDRTRLLLTASPRGPPTA